MSETAQSSNTKQSPSSALPTEIENEAQRLNLQRQELDLNEKRLKSWRTDNDTLTAFFEMLKIPVSILVFLAAIYFIYEKERSVILSMGSGCEFPPGLAVDLAIPRQPYMSEDPDFEEYADVSEMDKKQLVAAIVRRDNDRAEIRRICKL